MYFFSEELFKNLPLILGLSQKDFSKKAFGSIHKYTRRLDSLDYFPFQELVDLCNAFHISLTSFISTSSSQSASLDSKMYVIPENIYLPITFNYENIRHIYGKNGLVKGLQRTDIARDFGVSGVTVSNWSTPGKSFVSIGEVLGLCNKYGIDLEFFVVDPNKPLPTADKEEDQLELTPKIWAELTELRNAEKELRSKVEFLTHENTQLKLTMHNNEYHVMEPLAGYNQEKTGSRKGRQWIAHWQLLCSLHTVLGISRKKMLEECGLKNTAACFNEGDMTLSALVKICNRWKISTRHFFLRDTGISPVLYTGDFYFSDQWTPVVFHPEHISDLYGKNSLTGLNKEELAETESLSEWKIRAWAQPNSPMRISDLLNICNELDVTPSCFITDKNRTEISYPMTYVEFLIEENRALRQKLLRMERKKR